MTGLAGKFFGTHDTGTETGTLNDPDFRFDPLSTARGEDQASEGCAVGLHQPARERGVDLGVRTVYQAERVGGRG